MSTLCLLTYLFPSSLGALLPPCNLGGVNQLVSCCLSDDKVFRGDLGIFGNCRGELLRGDLGIFGEYRGKAP